MRGVDQILISRPDDWLEPAADIRVRHQLGALYVPCHEQHEVGRTAIRHERARHAITAVSCTQLCTVDTSVRGMGSGSTTSIGATKRMSGLRFP